MFPHDEHSVHNPDRRGFLKTAVGITGGIMVSGLSKNGNGSPVISSNEAAQTTSLPTVQLFNHTVTRMIVGANPIWGWGHRGKLLEKFLQDYFTNEKAVEFLHSCERAGINTWQTNYDKRFHAIWTKFCDEGGKLNLVLLYDYRETTIENLAHYKPVAILHHGNVTDDLFRAGKIEQVHDFVKKVHDIGFPSGPSTHNPDVVTYACEHNWENDIFQTCVYEQSRPRDQWKKQYGFTPLDETYIDTDPPRMCAVIRSTNKPCLAFKILAAGRVADKKELREAAFKFAYENIKKSDCIIVGMIPKFDDQISENVEYVKKYGVVV